MSSEPISIDAKPLQLHPDDVETKENQFMNISDRASSILFEPAISTGVVKIDVLNIESLEALGIADETVRYDRIQRPEKVGWEKIVYYHCNGGLGHIGDWVKGNAEFDDKHRIQLEINMNTTPRTLTFFYDDVEQPNYVVNIPSSVRFWAFIWKTEECFKLLKFESITEPISKHGDGSKALEFGKDWSE
ncbi:MAG: hypothetical protein EZS28_009294 [Streblomastix strix]|uniref:Uncharacterized protein n=1 Tax=Streblomastix strix TaxID=222440 RepID=A0A5J4WJP5_9EUKA|nr:MAG: hypothetical protein EZS28_009294 [Streblomastix strix]